MTEAYFVLWLLFSTPWALGPVPMGPGWAGVALLDREACATALERSRQPGQCLPGGAEAPGPVAEILRR